MSSGIAAQREPTAPRPSVGSSGRMSPPRLVGTAVTGESARSLLATLTACALAPNGRTGWRLRPRDGAIEVAVRRQLLDASAPAFREIAIAAGAAVFMLWLGIAELGHRPVVEWWPFGRD